MPTLLPNGLRVIRLFPEWVSGWPLWENFTDNYRLSRPDLGLTPELSQALYDWNETWLMRQLDDPVPGGWREQGERLVLQLQAELAGVAEVRPELLS